MTATALRIERELDQLPLNDLVELYPRIIEKIYTKEDAEGLDPAFRDDILRRIEEIRAGRAEGMDAFKALGEM